MPKAINKEINKGTFILEPFLENMNINEDEESDNYFKLIFSDNISAEKKKEILARLRNEKGVKALYDKPSDELP